MALAALGWATAGGASLGHQLSSIETDRVHLSASAVREVSGNVTIHTLTTANGSIVKEYANSDGTVFAVNWRGAGRPDLSQLLGDRASALAAMHHPGRPHMRRLMTVQHSDLVVLSQGHPGAFFGLAYDPALVPAGFSLDALR